MLGFVSRIHILICAWFEFGNITSINYWFKNIILKIYYFTKFSDVSLFYLFIYLFIMLIAQLTLEIKEELHVHIPKPQVIIITTHEKPEHLLLS